MQIYTWAVKSWCVADRAHEVRVSELELHHDVCPIQDLDISLADMAQLHSIPDITD